MHISPFKIMQCFYVVFYMVSSEDGECSSNIDDAGAVGPIRKRRFSNARIQPTRIKKVMQSDEDIGRMVASVPVAVGSAMEHFAEKILEAAAGCVSYSSSRTLSPMHIKYAIMQNAHFAFLESLTKEIKLPKLSADSTDTQGSSSTSSLASPSIQYRQFGSLFDGIKNAIPEFIFPGAASKPVSSFSLAQHHSSLSVALPLPKPHQNHVSFDLSNLSTPNITSPSSSNAQNTIPLVQSLPNAAERLTILSNAEAPTSNNNNLDVKRKRGRPKLEKAMASNLNVLLPTNTKLHCVNNSNGGCNQLTFEKNDSFLMPPPTSVPTKNNITSPKSQPADVILSSALN